MGAKEDAGQSVPYGLPTCATASLHRINCNLFWLERFLQRVPHTPVKGISQTISILTNMRSNSETVSQAVISLCRRPDELYKLSFRRSQLFELRNDALNKMLMVLFLSLSGPN